MNGQLKISAADLITLMTRLNKRGANAVFDVKAALI